MERCKHCKVIMNPWNGEWCDHCTNAKVDSYLHCDVCGESWDYPGDSNCASTRAAIRQAQVLARDPFRDDPQTVKRMIAEHMQFWRGAMTKKVPLLYDGIGNPICPNCNTSMTMRHRPGKHPTWLCIPCRQQWENDL